MEIRQSFLKMIKAYQGGWDAMAAALGMSCDALENRIYERKGQGLNWRTCMQIQKFSGTEYFAEAVASASGGAFVKLPDAELHNDDLLRKFNELYAELGKFAGDFNQATADEQIDRREAALLQDDADRVHKLLSELLALALRVYTPQQRREVA